MARTKRTKAASSASAEKRPRRSSNIRDDDQEYSDDDNNNNNANSNRNRPRKDLVTHARDKPAPTDDSFRPQRYRPGTRAIMDIRKHQRHTRLLVPRLPMSRVIREIGHQNVNNIDPGHSFQNRFTF